MVKELKFCFSVTLSCCRLYDFPSFLHFWPQKATFSGQIVHIWIQHVELHLPMQKNRKKFEVLKFWISWTLQENINFFNSTKNNLLYIFCQNNNNKKQTRIIYSSNIRDFNWSNIWTNWHLEGESPIILRTTWKKNKEENHDTWQRH
jgi:hypothetical protein